MVRRRGASRRGGTAGNRGQASQSVPQNISPLASASPSSSPSSHSRPIPNNSFQTTRFKFRSRLNKPLLSASITVILTEEEDTPNSSANTTISQSQNESGLQGEITRFVFGGDNMQDEGEMPEAPQPPPDSSKGKVLACEPVHHPGSILNLVIPPDGGVTGDADNVMVTWIGSPSKVDKDTNDSPNND